MEIGHEFNDCLHNKLVHSRQSGCSIAFYNQILVERILLNVVADIWKKGWAIIAAEIFSFIFAPFKKRLPYQTE